MGPHVPKVIRYGYECCIWIYIYATCVGDKMARAVAYLLRVLNVGPHKIQTYLGVLNMVPSVPRW